MRLWLPRCIIKDLNAVLVPEAHPGLEFLEGIDNSQSDPVQTPKLAQRGAFQSRMNIAHRPLPSRRSRHHYGLASAGHRVLEVRQP